MAMRWTAPAPGPIETWTFDEVEISPPGHGEVTRAADALVDDKSLEAVGQRQSAVAGTARRQIACAVARANQRGDGKSRAGGDTVTGHHGLASG